MNYRNAKFLPNADIDCEVLHATLGWIPTTLSAQDLQTKDQHALVSKNETNNYIETSTEIETVRNSRLKELSRAAQREIEVITPTYPVFETLTFERQRIEAIAWQENPTIETPCVDILASHRGIDRIGLLSKIILKVAEFELAALNTAGKRQRHADQLKAAKSVDEINAVAFSFQQ